MVSQDGEPLGRVSEVVVSPDEPYPLVRALQVRTEDGALFLPAEDISAIEDGKTLRLDRPLSTIRAYMPQPHDFSLVRDVLDKQIVDVHDYRVVRVNDIRLASVPDKKTLALLGVDIGVRRPDAPDGARKRRAQRAALVRQSR